MKRILMTALIVGLAGGTATLAHEPGHEHGQPGPQAKVDAHGNASYGQPMPAGAAIPVTEAIAHSDKYLVGTHKIGGRIAKVCQNAGCWMVLGEGEKSARVMFTDNVVIPVDATGEAEVYGTLSVKVLDEATAKHLAEDAGLDPSKVVGESKEVRISASSVVLKPLT